MEEEWRIADTAEYLCTRNFTVVAAQFPDELLAQATRVATLLQAECTRRGHAVEVSSCPASAPAGRPPALNAAARSRRRLAVADFPPSHRRHHRRCTSSRTPATTA